MLDQTLSEVHVALYRVVAMEALRFPQLGARFYQLGPKRGDLLVSRYLEGQIKLGRLARENPLVMAQHLTHLFTGGPMRWALLGLRPYPGTREKLRHVDAVVKVFLRAYSTDRAARGRA